MRLPLILASASPRRRALLASLGLDLECMASERPEIPEPGEDPERFACRVANEKALAVAERRQGVWVLAGDTVVELDGEILGKPASADEAKRMLSSLSGRRHQVVTAVALVDTHGALRESFAVKSAVTFRVLSTDEISRYVAGGEPMDKAGAYAIQGGAADFVREVVGSYSNVVGLPLDEVGELLRRHDLLDAPTAAPDERVSRHG